MVNAVVHSAHLIRSKENIKTLLCSDKKYLFADRKLIAMITFNIDILISLRASWWFIMKTIMKYININYLLLFFILFSMFFIPSRITFFSSWCLLALAVNTLIKKVSTKMNGYNVQVFFYHEGIDKIWHAVQLSASVGVSSFTLLSLEAVAPFIVRYQTVLVGVTRIKECLCTLFILIQVNASKLWLVQQ